MPIVISLLSVAAIAWSLPVRPIAEALQVRAQNAGLWGAAMFAGLFVTFTTFLIPVWPMPFAAGALYGPVWGTALASASCVTAAAVTFFLARLLGRTSFRSSIENSPRMKALQHTVDVSDWKIVAAVRLSHFMTFGMQNYAFGLTNIRFVTFLFTTWAVTLPGTSLQAYLGHLGFSSVDAWSSHSLSDWQTWALRIVGLCPIVAAVVYVGYRGRAIYRKALKKQLEDYVVMEERRDANSNRSTWKPGLLWVASLCLTTAAIWSVVERHALHDYVVKTFVASSEEPQS